MSQTESPSSCLSDLERIYQNLGYTEEIKGSAQKEESILSELSPEIQQHLQETVSGKWPLAPASGVVPDAREATQLKVYLAWTVDNGQFWKAIAAILLLESCRDDAIEASLFNDVMQHIEEKGPHDVIPPQLLVNWAKHLQVKGDLHGAIRRLNAARTLISDHKSAFPCPCEVQRIRGECTQLAGLTLNKMCCWKNAVQPLMESVDIFRACAVEDRNLEAIVVSLEIAAKCLCNLPHGDYLELKGELGFQHGDRFYQAYTMCKDAAGLASSSQLLLVRAQNQAAESLLKFAAQHEDDAKRYQYLEQVVSEAQKSLRAHTSALSLSRREQFFEFVHSLFLISVALNFSDCFKDRTFADTLGEHARFLYAEYCRQLSEKDFQPTSIRLDQCPQAESIIHSLAEVFNLSLDLMHSTEQRSEDGQGIDKEEEVPSEKSNRKSYQIVNGHNTDRLDGKIQSMSINADDSNNQRTEYTKQRMVQPSSSADRGTQKGDVNGELERLPAEIQKNGHGKSLQLDVNTPLDLVKERKSDGRKESSSLNTQQNGIEGNSAAVENIVQNGGEDHIPPPPIRRQQEVGLPVDPEEYSIPLYDVPLSIFQDLIGCKFSGVTTAEDHPGTPPSNTEGPVLQEQEIRLDQELTRRSTQDGSREGAAEDASMRGITEDSGYGSSVALVDTCLTTKLLTQSDMGSLLSSGADSGVGSSFSSLSGDGLSRSENSSGGSLGKLQGPSLSLSGSAVHNTVRKARLLKFNPVTGIWSSQMTLVYVGQPLQLDPKVKGNCRDALHVQFLHQDEVLGRYVGKRYRRQRPPNQYLQDVTCQKTARFLVTLFNYALKDLRYDIQVVYVPVAHVQLLSRNGEEVEDWLNVEPYLDGDFIKLTNNLHFCNSQGRTLATALTHFTHSVSDGKLMLVDLQGWLPREGRGVVYLTDPQFHTSTPTSLSSCDMGPKGMQAFWERVHPQCNAICHALGLKRPSDLQDA